LHVKKLKADPDIPVSSYRMGHFRILLAIEDDAMVTFVIEIWDRSKVYLKY